MSAPTFGTVKTVLYIGMIIIIIVIVIKIYTYLQKSDAHAAKTKNVEENMNKDLRFKPTSYLSALQDASFDKSRLLSDSDAKNKAKIIRDSLFGFLDWHKLLLSNNSAIQAVFRSLTDIIQVSQLAFVYNDIYNEDMAEDIQHYTNSLTYHKDLQDIMDTIDTLGQ
jgi:hypothetical protein